MMWMTMPCDRPGTVTMTGTAHVTRLAGVAWCRFLQAWDSRARVIDYWYVRSTANTECSYAQRTASWNFMGREGGEACCLSPRPRLWVTLQMMITLISSWTCEYVRLLGIRGSG